MNESYIFLNLNKDKEGSYFYKMKDIIDKNDGPFHFVNLYSDIIFFHHPYMWKNENGVNPDIGTIIRKKDIEKGYWRFHRYNEEGTVLRYICSFIDIHGPIEIINDNYVNVDNGAHFDNIYIDFIKNSIRNDKEIVIWSFINDLNIYYESVFTVYVSNIRKYTDFSYFLKNEKIHFMGIDCDFLNKSVKEAKNLDISFSVM